MKKREWLLLGFTVCIGFFLACQVQISNGQKLYVSPKVLDDYAIAIESEKQSLEQIEQRIHEAGYKLKEYEAYEAEEDDDNSKMQAETKEKLDYYKLVSQSTPVNGQGISIHIDDGTRELYEGESPNNILVHDGDLLVIINDLIEAGAEAISVNGHRITNNSSISCSGYTVRINGQFEARPFRIDAIGDANRMASNLLGTGGTGTILKDYGLQFKVTIKDELSIPAYTEDRNYRYMTITKEGETN